MNDELDLIIQQMVESGESDEAIQGVIDEYNSSEAVPVKKKEVTESVSTSVEEDSSLVGSETKPDLGELVATKAPRQGGRDNEDGTHSSHLMAQQDNVAFPTLFQNDDGTWEQVDDFSDARKEAEKRGEVFKFDSEQEAMDFAEGAWKETKTPVEEKPDILVDEPIAQLYNQYKQEGKIKPAQQQAIEAKIKAQEKGERGFFETAAAITEGFLRNGTAIPVFQFNTEDELIAGRELKNKTDFLKDLPEETLAELKSYAGEKISDLESDNMNALFENKMMEERGKQVVNELKYAKQGIEALQEQGKDIPDEVVAQYTALRDEVQSISLAYNENFDSIENNNKDIGDFNEEVALLKKNYGGLDYYMDLTGITASNLVEGAKQFEMSTIEQIEDKTGLNVGIGDKEFQEGVKEDIKKRRDFANKKLQEELRPMTSVSDIDGMGTFMEWIGEQAATQLPVLTVLAAGGGAGGLGFLGASSGGQKIAELQDTREEAKKTISQLDDILDTGEFTEEELADIDKQMTEAKRSADITDDEMYVAGLGTGVLEILTERVTLGILSKGKRAYLAAKKTGGHRGANFVKGTGLNVGAGISEGGAEFINAFGTNLIDIMYLNDPDVHIFDGTLDALASGGAMGFAMRAAPAGLGIGAKAFMSKAETAVMKSKSKKISNILGEIEDKGDTMDADTKKMLTAKANKLKKEVAKGMKKAFDNVARRPKENTAELLKLDKAANKLMRRVQKLQKTDVNQEMKDELMLDLKADLDKIIERKTELLEQDNGTKPKDTEKQDEGAVEGGTKGDSSITEETTDTSESTDAPRPKVRLKRQKKGIYMDSANEYTVQKTKDGNWQVITADFVKGKTISKGNVLTEVKTLKEARVYLEGQTAKRNALLDEVQVEADGGTMFDVDTKKSEFHWRKLLAGVPVITYVDELLFTKGANWVEKGINRVASQAFTGKLAIDAKGKNLATRAGAKVVNTVVAQAATMANSLYTGVTRTDTEIMSARRLEGFQEKVIVQARVLTASLSNMIDSNPESAKRVHQALDPEIYDETVKYEDLNDAEKNLFDSLRTINQATHEANFKNGFISKETFDKYDGNYIGRGYEIHEGLTEEAERAVFIDNKIFGKIYKQRQEVNQWVIDNTVNDPIYLTMNRMARTQRNIVVKEYADFISDTQGETTKPETGFYAQLNGKAYGKLNGKWVPSNVAADFKGYFFNNELLDALHKAADMYNQTGYKQFMKRYHTVYSPLVQVGNLMSNHAFAFAAGVNVVQLYMELPQAYADLRSKQGDYENVLQEGLIGSNVLDKDLQLSSDFSKKLSLNGKKGIGKLDQRARKFYSGSDNVMKLAAYKAQKRLGYTHEEAVQRVYEGFQNYASVGKIWDLASKLPVWGSDYVKFQGDLNRIVKNAATKRPLTTLSFLYGLSAVASLLSRASGEEEAEQYVRENRKYIPKITTWFGDFPLIFRVPGFDKEVNVARYLSPFYKYDKGQEHWVERVSQYAPLNLNVDEETGTLRVVPSDVATGSIWAAFMDNKDFRNQIISDPNYNIYTGTTASEGQKLTNRVVYVLRSQLPLFSYGHDLVLSNTLGEDYYGRDKSPLDVIISRVVKIQTWDSDTTRDQLVKALKSINFDVRKLKTQRSSISNKYDKEVAKAEAKFNEGTITRSELTNKVENLRQDFEKRNSGQALKEARVQEEFNKLKENSESIGVNFNSILSKASE